MSLASFLLQIGMTRISIVLYIKFCLTWPIFALKHKILKNNFSINFTTMFMSERYSLKRKRRASGHNTTTFYYFPTSTATKMLLSIPLACVAFISLVFSILRKNNKLNNIEEREFNRFFAISHENHSQWRLFIWIIWIMMQLIPYNFYVCIDVSEYIHLNFTRYTKHSRRSTLNCCILCGKWWFIKKSFWIFKGFTLDIDIHQILFSFSLSLYLYRMNWCTQQAQRHILRAIKKWFFSFCLCGRKFGANF